MIIPTKRTNVTPNETPATFILPNKAPMAIMKAYKNMMYATLSAPPRKLVKKLLNHSIKTI